MVNQYVLKVYPLGLGNEVYRTLEICGDSTLDQLCDAIMEAFDFSMSICMSSAWTIKCSANTAISIIRWRKNWAWKALRQTLHWTKSACRRGRSSPCITILATLDVPDSRDGNQADPAQKEALRHQSQGRDSAISELILILI